jgi:methylenetetrahydrofolate reductase (NADPH)
VNNDFHQTKTIFDLLKNLEVKGLTTPASPKAAPVTNGAAGKDAAPAN